MDQTSVLGIEPETPLESLSQDTILKLWDQVTRHHNGTQISNLVSGYTKPSGPQEERVIEVALEMESRGLLSDKQHATEDS